MKYHLNYDVKPDEYSEVVYGDSVTGDTPLLLKKDEKIYIKTIASIFDDNKKVDYSGFKMFDTSIKSEKEQSFTDYQAWSDIGWVDIKKVIRHKCVKEIYKVSTQDACVKVTEDHSLIDTQYNLIKPAECRLGTKLLTHYPSRFSVWQDGVSEDKVFVYGLLYGYGRKIPNIDMFFLEISDIDTLRDIKDIINREYPDVSTHLITNCGSLNTYKLALWGTKDMIDDYMHKFYNSDKQKAIPDEMLNGSVSLARKFLSGYYTARGGIKSTDDSIAAAGIYYLEKKAWNDIPSSGIRIKEIVSLGKTDDYVYDIETECGRFQAGVGDIIVKNTDSCFIKMKTPALYEFENVIEEFSEIIKLTPDEQEKIDKYKTRALEEAFDEGKILSKKTTAALFKKPIDLEFEKVYYPFILLSKKRYIGNYYGSTPHKIDFVEKKGIVLKRRDNPEIVKKVYLGVLNPILEHGTRGSNISIAFLKKQLDDLMNNRADLNDLVVTKTLAKGYGTVQSDGTVVPGQYDYKNFNIPHVALAIKMRERDPGSAPAINDRISYVFVELPGNPMAKLYEKVEDLQTAIEKKMDIDVLYYVDNQLKNPIKEILSLIVKDVDAFFDDATRKYKEERSQKVKRQKIMAKVPKGQPSILKWIKPKND
jgi:DNA polymerase elongation subunit (family B)